jgi:hypothetical protein
MPDGRLAMRWLGRPGILPFDPQPEAVRRAGWLRFTAPPGLRAMTVRLRGTARAWAGGRELSIEGRRRLDDGSFEETLTVKDPEAGPGAVAVRIEEERGARGGAAILEPIALRCGPGLLETGDWSRIDGLAFYSGGAWYRRTVSLSAAGPGARVVLDLGAVASSAEVRVNGERAGIRVAPPWKVDITHLVRPGDNRIEILVLNTLANHYGTIPTRYRGSPVSGLLGPVRIESADPVVLEER